MTVYILMVGISLLWFAGFLYVIRWLHLGERFTICFGQVRRRAQEPGASDELSLARTIVRSGGWTPPG